MSQTHPYANGHFHKVQLHRAGPPKGHIQVALAVLGVTPPPPGPSLPQQQPRVTSVWMVITWQVWRGPPASTRPRLIITRGITLRTLPSTIPWCHCSRIMDAQLVIRRTSFLHQLLSLLDSSIRMIKFPIIRRISIILRRRPPRPPAHCCPIITPKLRKRPVNPGKPILMGNTKAKLPLMHFFSCIIFYGLENFYNYFSGCPRARSATCQRRSPCIPRIFNHWSSISHPFKYRWGFSLFLAEPSIFIFALLSFSRLGSKD